MTDDGLVNSTEQGASAPPALPYQPLLTNSKFFDWVVGFLGSVCLFILPPVVFALANKTPSSFAEAFWVSYVLIFSWPLAIINWPFTYLDTSLLLWFSRLFGPGVWKVWGMLLFAGFIAVLALTWKRYSYVRRGLIWFGVLGLLLAGTLIGMLALASRTPLPY